MYKFLKTQKNKILIALITVIMTLSVSTVLFAAGTPPVVTPLAIDSTGRISGEITTSTNISFKVEDNNQITNFYYAWDRNIAGNTTFQKIPANNAKTFTAQIPTSSIPKEPGVHELSIYASNGPASSTITTIPYYVVSNITGEIDDQAPTLVMPTTTVLAINTKIPLKYIENETAIYRIRYEWSTNNNGTFENVTTIYKPENGEIEIQTPPEPGLYYLKTDARDASNNIYGGAIITFDIRKELNPPTINGVGSTEIFHQKGIEYTYPNVTATDDTDGEVTVNKTTDLDTTKIGNYTITYTATDSSKNQARVDVVVHVIDYSLLDEELEKAKDLVETDYDKETWDKLQEEIKKAEDLKNENKSLQDKIDETVENIKNIIKETQKEENIKKPTITNMQVTATEYVKIGDKVTFTFTSDTELNRNQKITINGVAVNVTLTGDFPNYVAELTIPSDSKMNEGPINYTFQAEKTLTTVVGTQITKKSEPQEGTLENIKLDKTKPTITYKDTVKFDEDGNAYIELLAKDTYNKGIDYVKYLEITENYGTPAENWLFVSGAIDTNVPKETPYVLTYTVTDLAGNVSDPKTLNIYVKDYIETIEIKDTTKKTYTYGQTVQKQDAIADITMAGGTKYEAVSLSDESISSIQDAITLSVDSQDAGNRIVTITYKTKTAESTLGDRTLTYNITIEKATYNIEGIKFQDKNNNEIAENGTITYDGTAQTLTATNLPTTPAGLSVASYTYKNSAGATVTEVKNAGTYTVTVNFQVADNNNFEVPASITRTFEITKKELELSDLEITKPTEPIYYDETKTVEVGVTGKAGIEGLGTIVKKYYKVTETGETLVTAEDGAPATSVTEAGTYKVKISLSNEQNYTITAGELEVATFEIKKAEYNITGKYTFNNGEATYDGTVKTIANPTLPVGVEILSTEYKLNGKVADAVNAGTYTVTITLGLTGEYSKNYETVKPQTITANLVIKPMPITTLDEIKTIIDITANTENLTYNKAPQNVVTAVVKADKAGVGTPVITYYQGETKLTGAPTNAGDYKAKISLNGATNYEIVTESKEIEVTNFTITKATHNMDNVTITGQTQTYDGTAKKLTVLNLPEGVTISEIIYKNSQGTIIAGPVDVGTNYTATIKYSWDTTNYENVADKEVTMVVEPKELSLSDLNVVLPTAPIEYKENEAKQVTVSAKSGVNGLGTIVIKYYKVTADGEELVTAEDGTTPVAGVITVGEYKAKISITNQENYKITAGELEIASFEIKKATYDISDVKFTGKTTIYDGQAKQLQIANEPAGITNISYVYKDKAGNIITEADGETPVESVKNAGEYTVVATLEGDTENYELVPEQTAKLTINKRPITITAQNQTSVYGSEVVLTEPGYTYPETDLVAGDTLAVVLSTPATQTPVVGTYDIEAQITISDNYEVTYNKGTYEITRKLLELGDLDVAMPDSLEYDGNSKIVTVVPKADKIGIGTPIKIYYYKDRVEANKTEIAPINAGTYAVRVEVPQGDNYTASGTINEEKTFVKGLFDLNNLVIEPKSARVTMDEQSSTYGDPIVTKISTVATGVVGTDDLELTLTPVDGEGNALTPTTPAGDNYQITGTSTNPNYNVEIIPGKYTINPKRLADVTRTVTEPIGDALKYVKDQAKEVTAVLTTTINKEAYTLIKQDAEHETNYDYVETITYYEPAKPEDTEKETINGKDYKEIKDNGKPENVGTYIAKITFKGHGNFTGERINYSKEYSIIKADPEYTVPTNLEADYNTKLSQVELPKGFTFENMTADTLVGDVGTNNFTLTYTPEDTNNYNTIPKIPVTIKVNAIKYPLSGYTLPTIISKEYQEGTKQTVQVEGLPEGITATYTYKAANNTTTTDGMTDYGDYEVTVALTITDKGPLSKNYNGVEPAELKTTLRITKSVYKLQEKFNLGFTGDTNPTYSGESKTLTLTNETAIKTAGVDVDYEYYKADENGNILLDQKLDSAPVDAGKYVVRAQFKLTENGPLSQNYGGINPSNKDANLEISPKAPTVSDLTITMPSNLEYDGQAKQVIVKSKNWTAEKPNGDGLGDITVYYYKDGELVENEDGTPATSVKDFGTYNIKVSITKGTNYKEATLLDLGETNNLVITKKPLHNDDVDTNQVATTVEYGSDVAAAVRAQIEKAIKPGVTAEIISVTYNNTTTMPTEVREEAYTIIVILKGTGNYSPEEKDNVRIEAKCTITARQIKPEEISITEPTANLVYSKNSEGVEQAHPVITKISTSINGVNYDLDEDDVTITSTYYVKTETVPEGTLESDIYTAEDGTKYVKITGEPKNAGTYIAKITATGKGNFKNTSVEKYSNTYTIDKAMYELDKTGLNLVVTPATDKIVYNGNSYSLAIPEANKPAGLVITYTYNGVVGTSATDAGTYAVVATFDLDETLSPNYYNDHLLAEKLTGTLVIEKADEATPTVKLVQIVEERDEELQYSEELQSYVIKMTEANPTLRISNNPTSGISKTITTSNNKITINETTNEVTLNENGEVTITVTFPESKNYKENSTTIKLTIQLDTLENTDFEVDPDTTTYTYDSVGKTATVTTDISEVETGKVTTFYYKMNGETPDKANKLTAPVDAGTYGIYVQTVGGTKYEAVTVENAIKVGTLTINPRPVTITAENQTSVYRDQLAKLTYNITPGEGLEKALVGTDKETVTLKAVDGEGKPLTPVSPVSGTYTITGTYSISDNYAITFVPGIYTLTKRMPTVDDIAVTMPSNLEYNGEAKTVTVVANPVTGETLAGKGLGIIKVYYGETETAPVDAGTYKVKVAIEEGSNYTASVVEVESEDGEKTLQPTKFNLPDLVITPKPVTVTITKATSKYGETPSIEKTMPALVGQDTLGESIIAVEKDGTTEISSATPVGSYDIKTNYTNKNYKVTFVQTGSEKLKYEITPNPVTTIRVIAPTENLVFTENTEHPVTVEVLDPTKTDETLLTEKTAEQDGQYTKTVTYYEPATAEDTNTLTINGKEYKKVTGTPIEAGTYIAKAEVTGLGNFEAEAPVVGYSEKYTLSKASQNPPVVKLHKTSTTGEQPELDKIDGQEGKYREKITETNKIMAVVPAGKGDTTYDLTPKDIISIDENGIIKLQKAGEVTITVTYEGNKNYEPNSSTVTLKVIKDTLDADDFGVKEDTDIYTYDGAPKKATVISTIKAGDRGEVTESYYLIGEDEEGNEVSVATTPTANPTDAGKYAIFVTVTEGNKYEAITENDAIRLKDNLVINPRPATVTITKAESKFGEDINIVKTTEGEVTIGDQKEDLGLSLIAVEKDGTTPITSSTGVGTYEIKTNATNKNYKVTFVPAEPVYKIIANPVKEIEIVLPEGILTFEENVKHPVTVDVKDPTKVDGTPYLKEQTEAEPNGVYTKQITYYQKIEEITGIKPSDLYQD